MKIITLASTAVKNTLHSKMRTILTVVSIVIGSFTLSITTAMGTGINSYIDDQVNSAGTPNVITVAGEQGETVDTTEPQKYDPDATASSTSTSGVESQLTVLTDDDVKKVSALDEVISVDKISTLSATYVFSDDVNNKYTVIFNSVSLMVTPQLVAGEGLNNDSSNTENQILLPKNYLEPLGFDTAEDAVGKLVTFGVSDLLGNVTEITATINGVQEDSLLSSGITVNSVLQNSIADITYAGVEGGAPTVLLAVQIAEDSTADEAANVAAEISAMGYQAQSMDEALGIVKSLINGIVTVLNLFALIALIAAGFGVVNTLFMSVQERTREIGLMKAMGMSSGKVFSLFSFEAIFIGLLGSATGITVAAIIGNILNIVLRDGILKDLDGLNLFLFDGSGVLLVTGVVVTMTFLAGTLPAYKAATKNPIDALRYE